MRLSITLLCIALLRKLSRSTPSIAATSRPSLIVMVCHPQHDGSIPAHQRPKALYAIAVRAASGPIWTWWRPIRRSVQAKAIEPAFWEAVERALNNPALMTAELERQREGTSARQDDLDREQQHYVRQLAQCDKDLKRWEAAYRGEAIDLADFQ